MSRLILGIDAGNYQAKTVGDFGIDSYRTAICDWFERDFVESFGEDDMEFMIDNRKGYAGSIAVYEDVYGGSGMYGDSKAHTDSKIRILLAIYRYINKYCRSIDKVSIVIGQPIISHKEEEKQKLINMLKGHHEFTVNGERQNILIENIGVAAEGSGAFWNVAQNGKFRILDVGSGTVNASTIIDKKHINTASNTFNFGMETVNRGLDSIARGIIRETTRLNWQKTDTVLICGGVANEILPFIKEHYSNATTIQPTLKRGNSMKIISPTFSNAVGFHQLARLNFE